MYFNIQSSFNCTSCASTGGNKLWQLHSANVSRQLQLLDCDFSSASWLPGWNEVLERPCCERSVDSTESCMTVCYGSGCTWGNIWRLLWAFLEQQYTRGQKDQLKATGLLTLKSYLTPALPQVYTLANRPDIRISSSVLARGFGPPQGFEVCVSFCRRWTRVSIIWLVFPLASDQPVSMRNRPRRRGEGRARIPAQHSTASRCSTRVTVSCSKGRRTDCCKTYTCFAHCHVRLSSPVAPRGLSYLLFLSRLLANCDICSKMKASENLNANILVVDRQNEQTEECLSLCGSHPSNERLHLHIVYWRNGHF